MATQLLAVPSSRIESQPASEQRHNRRLLVVSDQHLALDMPPFHSLGESLQSAGFHLYPVCTSQDVLHNDQFQRPDAILIDHCLPKETGIWIIQFLRQRMVVPIVVISVRQDDFEKISCLDAGADDYLAKPFAVGELLARLRAALRRVVVAPHGDVFNSGDLRIDFDSRQVWVGDLQIKVTATEYSLLKVLAGHAGLVRTHHQLIHELWGATHYQDAVHLLRVTVSNLRRKLPSDSSGRSHIVTELGIGYRLRHESGLSAV